MLKKILALTVATVMVVSMGLMSFAATNNRALDGSMTVSGLTSGDEVVFYQILQWSGTHSGTGGWITGPGSSQELTDAKILEMIGSGTNPQMGITYEIASDIAQHLSGTGAFSGTVAGNSITYTTDVPGLYIVIITPKDAGVVYNPVFVSNDYNQSGTDSGSNEWPVNESGSYKEKAVAKKKTITLTKEITNQTGNNDKNIASGTNLEPDAGDVSYHSANLGDKISFLITTVVPSFSKEYTNPIFVVSDELEGLILDKSSLKVSLDQSGTNLLSGTAYTSGTTDTSYTITFDDDYLWRTGAAETIYIIYDATIDPSGTKNFNINEKDNTVTVNYSNNPKESGSSGTLKDRTKNYVFSIDADVLGSGSWIQSGTELVKVALDADGNEVLGESGTYLNSGSYKVGALQGAEFTWQAVNNSALSGTVTSDADGRLTIEGIDAGEYIIKETKAPDGYVQDYREFRVKIVPTLEKRDYYEDDVHVVYDRLVSYKVFVNNEETAEYIVTDDPSGSSIQKLSGTMVIGYEKPIEVISGTQSGSTKGKIQNTQGVALPSTGGIGTTLFYAGGAVLVLLAGVLLVSKRRIA